jgi:hypothetical protein
MEWLAYRPNKTKMSNNTEQFSKRQEVIELLLEFTKGELTAKFTVKVKSDGQQWTLPWKP